MLLCKGSTDPVAECVAAGRVAGRFNCPDKWNIRRAKG